MKSMFYAICFDVCDDRRLRKISNELENFGTRVQRSLFECRLNETDLNELKERLSHLIDETEDHIRYYPLCKKDQPKILIDGQRKVTPDPDFHLC